MGNVLGMTGSDFSISAWVKMTAGDSSESSSVIAKHRTWSNNGYFLVVNHSGILGQDDKAMFFSGDQFRVPVSTTSVNDGGWHHLVAVHEDGGNSFIYVDGSPHEGVSPAMPVNTSPAPLLVGGYDDLGRLVGSFSGLIDDVQVYNYALKANNVDFLFQNPGQVIPAHELPPGELRLNTFAGSGGTITRDPDLAKYTNGAVVTLTAVPSPGFVFTRWTGDATGTNNPITITMNANKTVTASFRDGAAPVVTIASPAVGTTSDERFQLVGTISDNVEVTSTRWEWNGQDRGSLSLSNGLFTVPNLRLAAGENRIRVLATDAAGNASSAEVVTTWSPARVLAVVDAAPSQEGTRISAPIELTSQGDVGGMSFVLRYDPAYLKEPALEWSSAVGSALNQVNYDALGEIRATFALPATAVPTGTQSVAMVSFRARSVPFTLSTDLTLELLDASLPTGDVIASGSTVKNGTARILLRRVIGDNNANDLLDVGDAALIQRLLTGLDPVRSWDVSGNDLNINTTLDSGDVVKLLRVVAELDPQPMPQPRPISSASDQVVLSLDKTRGLSGDLVILQVRLRGLTTPVCGASFALDYPTNALRLINSLSRRTGALVPSSAVTVWNVAPAQTDYAQQSGRITAGISSATAWPTNDGVLAELVFQVQAGQANQYRWPIRLNNMEVTPDGYDLQLLGSAETHFIGRDPVPASLGGVSSGITSEGFSISLSGDPGVVYTIERSSDLVTWTPLATVTNDDGTVTFVDPETPYSAHRFYRARQQ
jgi:uncharacterized repeat protein (TIGR02543 family)